MSRKALVPIELPANPTQPLEATTKQYVDGWVGLLAPAATDLTAGAGLTGGGTIAANRTFAVGAGTGITVNADDVAVNGATVQMKSEKGAVSGYASLGADGKVPTAQLPATTGIDLATGDARYVNIDGDTMTAPLNLSGLPASAAHAASKAYVDSLAYLDLQRCYFLLLLSNNYTFPVDGYARIPFDTENYDPAGIAAIGANSAITPPRNGRMQLNWAVSMYITSGSGTANMFSAIFPDSFATEWRRGGHIQMAGAVTGSTFASSGSCALQVSTGAKFSLGSYISAGGMGKAVAGNVLPVTWFEGYYLTA